jgi:hypothetical protein
MLPGFNLFPELTLFLYLFATTFVCPAQPVLAHALMLQRQETEEAVLLES